MEMRSNPDTFKYATFNKDYNNGKLHFMYDFCLAEFALAALFVRLTLQHTT